MKKIKYASTDSFKYRIFETFSTYIGIIPPEEIKTAFSSLDMGGNLTIEKGFCWDGASGGFDTDSIMRASCLHDALCSWMVKDLLPYDPYWQQANDLLREMSLEDGMSKFRAAYVFHVVKYHGRLRYGVE